MLPRPSPRFDLCLMQKFFRSPTISLPFACSRTSPRSVDLLHHAGTHTVHRSSMFCMNSRPSTFGQLGQLSLEVCLQHITSHHTARPDLKADLFPPNVEGAIRNFLIYLLPVDWSLLLKQALLKHLPALCSPSRIPILIY